MDLNENCSHLLIIPKRKKNGNHFAVHTLVDNCVLYTANVWRRLTLHFRCCRLMETRFSTLILHFMTMQHQERTTRTCSMLTLHSDYKLAAWKSSFLTDSSRTFWFALVSCVSNGWWINCSHITRCTFYCECKN